jgi:menaquinone-dependent protoporphyrinogen oxidase
MNVLVAVASKHGSTREIAEAIADELRSTGLAVDLRDVDEVAALIPYNALVFGSAIYAGSWLPEARRFAERLHAQCGSMPVWVWSSGPLGAPESQPHENPGQLAAPLDGVAIREHRIFEGRLDREKLGFAERVIVRVVKAPDGDFRDWEAIRAWAREIAAALAAVETEAFRTAG